MDLLFPPQNVITDILQGEYTSAVILHGTTRENIIYTRHLQEILQHPALHPTTNPPFRHPVNCLTSLVTTPNVYTLILPQLSHAPVSEIVLFSDPDDHLSNYLRLSKKTLLPHNVYPIDLTPPADIQPQA